MGWKAWGKTILNRKRSPSPLEKESTVASEVVQSQFVDVSFFFVEFFGVLRLYFFIYGVHVYTYICVSLLNPSSIPRLHRRVGCV